MQPVEEHIKHGLLLETVGLQFGRAERKHPEPSLRYSGEAALMGRARGQFRFCCLCRVFQPLLIQALSPLGLRDLFSQRCFAAVTKERITGEITPILVNIWPLLCVALFIE